MAIGPVHQIAPFQNGPGSGVGSSDGQTPAGSPNLTPRDNPQCLPHGLRANAKVLKIHLLTAGDMSQLSPDT
jgi:hypothetical protein